MGRCGVDERQKQQHQAAAQEARAEARRISLKAFFLAWGQLAVPDVDTCAPASFLQMRCDVARTKRKPRASASRWNFLSLHFMHGCLAVVGT